MSKVRILGIGSPSGDDQAGWLTVDALADCGVQGEHELAIDNKRFDQDAWPGYTHGLSSHGLGVLDALSLARAFGILPLRLDLYGIEIALACPGDEAGDDIQAAARHLARHIAADLAAASR
ncbi:MAG: hypothetical protein ABS93_02665 [Thiobacillus sp. SCN 62-729]|nr:MAG: hypothetical protein ABS93_02665 [Thiobacillus sp. SCN 62-729]